MSDTDEVIITKTNISAVNTGFDGEYLYVIIYLDSPGALSFSNATRAENAGKQILIIVTINGEDTIVSAGTICTQITNARRKSAARFPRRKLKRLSTA